MEKRVAPKVSIQSMEEAKQEITEQYKVLIKLCTKFYFKKIKVKLLENNKTETISLELMLSQIKQLTNEMLEDSKISVSEIYKDNLKEFIK